MVHNKVSSKIGKLKEKKMVMLVLNYYFKEFFLEK